MVYIATHKRKFLGTQIHETLEEKRKNEKETENKLKQIDSSLSQLKKVLEKQAINRLEGNYLRDEEAEKLGLAFMQLNETIEKIKKENNLEKTTSKIRADLDNLVNEGITN